MPLTRFRLSAIAEGGITTAKLADGAVTLGKTDSLFVNTEIGGTEGARLPNGTTAQRANAQTGDQRFNTTLNLMEYYDGNIWKAIDSPPTISSISPSTFDAVGDTITVNGSNFQTGINITVIGSDGTTYTPDSVTRVSSSEVTFDITTAIFNGGLDAFDIKAINVSGLSVTSANSLTIPNPTASFNSSATQTIYDSLRSSGFDAGVTLTGDVSESDVTLSYALTTGSLPAGASLNTSTGAITGISAVGSDTTSNFTITATVADASEGTSVDVSRAFALTIAAPVTQTFNYTGSAQTLSIPSGLTSVTATMWGGAGGGSIGESVTGTGGAGGFATGDIDVSSISSLAVIVGGGGGITGNGSSRGSRAYPNGGLGSLRTGYENGHGGGLSGVFNGSFTFANSLIIAGGGGGSGGKGGAGVGSTGGHGGGTTGGGGHSSNAGGQMTTTGATQSAGGVQTASAGRPNGTAPGQLQGGDAGNGQAWSTSWNATGGGGSGYYGGGQIDDNHAGGGGGSGYLHPSLVSNGTLTGLGHAVSGSPSSISPPQTGNTYYSSGIGVGNLHASGGNGKIVITY